MAGEHSTATGGASARDRGSAGSGLPARLGLPATTGEAIYNLACNNYLAGRVPKAERLLHALLLLEPGRPHAYLGLGIILGRRGNLGLAAIMFETAIQCQQDWAIPHFHLAATRLQQGRIDDALQSLTAFFAHGNGETPPEIIRQARRLQQFVEAGRSPLVEGEEAAGD